MRLDEIKNVQIRDAIASGLQSRVEAKDMEDTAEIIKTAANELLMPLLHDLTDQKVETDDNRLTLVYSSSSSFDKDLAKMKLVEAGLAAEVVAKIWDDCTVRGIAKPSVKLTAVKSKG